MKRYSFFIVTFIICALGYSFFILAYKKIVVYRTDNVKLDAEKCTNNTCAADRYQKPEDFEGFDNVSGTPDGCYVVPNYVHFVRLNQSEFRFADAVCVLAALKNQKPEILFFHTDVDFKGKYWEVLMNTTGFKEVLRINKIVAPTEIFGQPLSKVWLQHTSDVVRIRVIMEFGGIYLDNDSYLARSVDDLRRFELSLSWMANENLGNQAIIGHKNARFLSLWLETYRDYQINCWYCNGGIKPTQEVLIFKPYLVHRMWDLLAAHDGIMGKVFATKWDGWRDHYVIHLLLNHIWLLHNVTKEITYPVEFDEDIIKKYPIAFQDMVFDVYPITHK